MRRRRGKDFAPASAGYPYSAPRRDPLGREGEYVLTRDGKEIMRGSEAEIWGWMHSHLSYSVHHALTYEGYTITPVQPGTREARPTRGTGWFREERSQSRTEYERAVEDALMRLGAPDMLVLRYDRDVDSGFQHGIPAATTARKIFFDYTVSSGGDLGWYHQNRYKPDNPDITVGPIPQKERGPDWAPKGGPEEARRRRSGPPLLPPAPAGDTRSAHHVPKRARRRSR